MEIFLKTFQGAYAYILVLQIIAVSGLFLSLLWLLVQRIKESPRESLPGVTAVPTAQVTAPELVAAAGAVSIDQEANQELLTENQNLNDKLKYLESKLLEYEILQEEIGTLSSLKIENEQLKSKLMELESNLTPASAPLIEPPEKVSTPFVDHSPGPGPSEIAVGATFDPPVQEPLPEPQAVQLPADVSEASHSEPSTLVNASDPSLDGLLREIDALIQPEPDAKQP
jgi:hypothetical protein